jgi:hypothetical protein
MQCSSLFSGTITCFISMAMYPATRNIDFNLFNYITLHLVYCSGRSTCSCSFYTCSFSLTLNDHKHITLPLLGYAKTVGRSSYGIYFVSGLSKKKCADIQENTVICQNVKIYSMRNHLLAL